MAEGYRNPPAEALLAAAHLKKGRVVLEVTGICRPETRAPGTRCPTHHGSVVKTVTFADHMLNGRLAFRYTCQNCGSSEIRNTAGDVGEG